MTAAVTQTEAAHAPTKITIVGVDLSLTSTGICWGTHSTRTFGHSLPRDADESLRMARIRTIAGSVTALAVRFERERREGIIARGPVLVAMEDLIPGIKGASYAELVGLHYVTRYALTLNGIPYVLVHNSALKRYACGKGGGPGTDKTAVAVAVLQRFKVRHTTTDETDAWVLRAMALDHYGHPVAAMPKAHRDALAKIPWPDLEHADA